ncbi:N-alpha-acetyltransferase 38-A, NatC auxiliary subunit [Fopius arisanus]|uniref:N-alpha-acetyltransferase 38-A, NatC auxiliary subunit n=1 Tax=Fopius arisanus TaxID=64838 RepID=A0A9R1U6M2_9HYME|nr:PREDICTED: N-alpha-acetyltransferase 38-A, NatC auxiliary subunit [Fopius arisanus]
MTEMKEATNSVTDTECVLGNGETSPGEETSGKRKLRSWLNRFLRIKMTDGRVLTGAFLCTDRDANVILGSCEEFLSEDHTEARALGLVMVPGRHIVSIHLDAWCNENEKAA